jgi:hypothetical protein
MTVLTDRPPPQLDPSAVAGDVDAGVIKEARRRQRRRWLMAVVAVLVGSVVVVMIGSGGRGRTGGSPGPKSESRSRVGAITSPAKVFAQDPYMGVACHIANSIACDRVGLSVWLRRPAIVTATIAGAPLKLNAPDWSYVARDSRGALYVYAGFLQPAGITTRLHVEPDRGSQSTWGANPRIPPALPPPPTVRFRIDYGHGDVVWTQEHVWLSMGWG